MLFEIGCFKTITMPVWFFLYTNPGKRVNGLKKTLPLTGIFPGKRPGNYKEARWQLKPVILSFRLSLAEKN